MNKWLLGLSFSLTLLACEDSTTSGGGSDSNVDYSTTDINVDRIMDKGGVWVMDSEVATMAADSTLPEDVLALLGDEFYSTYLVKGSLKIDFEQEGDGYFAQVDYTNESGNSVTFYYNTVTFEGGTINLGGVVGCTMSGYICEVEKELTGKMTEDYIVFDGSPFLQNHENWTRKEIFKRVKS